MTSPGGDPDARRRDGGVLLRISSLPPPFGIGDPGPAAFRFADFHARSGQAVWQVLPLNDEAGPETERWLYGLSRAYGRLPR